MKNSLWRALALTAVLGLSACATPLSTRRTEPADLGSAATETDIVAAMNRPGVIQFEKIVSADWHFANTTRPPGATEWSVRQLDAQIYFYAIRHPRFGLYLIDAGMPADYEAHMGPILRRVMRNDYGFQQRQATEVWAATHGQPRGIFITHLHYDHVLGVVNLHRSTPVYVGPNDGAQRNFFYRFINQPTREALAHRPVRAWSFATPPANQLAAIDVFGDASLFAIYVPGHTPGSTAYLVNTTDGPQLVTGDAVHSREAWTGEVEEATGFEPDLPQIFASRATLQALAARIPNLSVHPGHQTLER
jgi:glyoxylase-like metal-dependent hydrolase (beta-lactamase superfamily II)